MFAKLVTVTNRELLFRIRGRTWPVAAIAAARRCVFLLEPFGRNTAPAVAVAALCRAARGWGHAGCSCCPPTT